MLRLCIWNIATIMLK
uniref:Uncharacterized protein n=1 Tax=Arundo donax TaxID=35708 RepID=A0A0A9B6U0_ARUDO